MKMVMALREMAVFIWLMALTLAIMLPASLAADVCTVIYFPGNTAESKCFSVTENSNGIDVLEKAGLRLLLAPPSQFGRMICKIDDVGTEVSGNFCAFSGEFWNFALRDGQSWRHMPIGFDAGDKCWNRDFEFSDFSQIVHYCAKSGDVLGLAFGKEGSQPDMLNVKEVRVFVDGEPDNDSFISGGTIDDGVDPGADILMKLTLQNIYSEKTGVRMNGVIVRGEINDIDHDNDIRIKLDEFTLDPGEKETVELRFTVPMIVEAKDYTMDVKVRAVDEFGIVYDKVLHFIIDVSKEQSRIKINASSLDKESYSCEDAAFLKVSVLNVGSKNADGALAISSGALGFSVNESFSLTNDVFEPTSRLERTFAMRLPQDLLEGSYPIDIRAKLKIGKAAIKVPVLQKKRCTEKRRTMDGFQEKEFSQKAQAGNPKPSSQQPSSQPLSGTTAKKASANGSGTKGALFVGGSLGFAGIILVAGIWYAFRMLKNR